MNKIRLAPVGSCYSGSVHDDSVMDVMLGAASLFSQAGKLHFQGFVGHSSVGDVYKAVWTPSTSEGLHSIVVCVKQLSPKFRPHSVKDRHAALVAADHQNIVKYLDLKIEPPRAIVTEFCSGGSLGELLHGSGRELTMRQKVKALLDVASGMEYLYGQLPHLGHRGLTSSSVMLTNPLLTPDHELHAKVADFGLSQVGLQGEQVTQTCFSGWGAWRWMAPEVFDIDESTPISDERADIFSFAMVMYEVAAGRLPYCDEFPGDELPDPRVGIHICLGLRPSVSYVGAEWPRKLSKLMERCWSEDPADRPIFAEVKQQLASLYNSVGTLVSLSSSL